jgi:hypothetical protein
MLLFLSSGNKIVRTAVCVVLESAREIAQSRLVFHCCCRRRRRRRRRRIALNRMAMIIQRLVCVFIIFKSLCFCLLCVHWLLFNFVHSVLLYSFLSLAPPPISQQQEQQQSQHTPVLRLLFTISSSFFLARMVDDRRYQRPAARPKPNAATNIAYYNNCGWIMDACCKKRKKKDRSNRTTNQLTKDGAVEVSPSPAEVVVWLTLLHLANGVSPANGWQPQQL